MAAGESKIFCFIYPMQRERDLVYVNQHDTPILTNASVDHYEICLVGRLTDVVSTRPVAADDVSGGVGASDRGATDA